MFANCQMGGQNFGMPDVCKTPVGPSVVPIPYPNFSMGAIALPTSTAMKVLISGGPAHTVGTTIPLSNGDNPGVLGGIKSGCVMGATKVLMGSTATFFKGKPGARLTSMTGHNGSNMNIPGMTIAPAQVKVLLLK